MKKNNLLGYRIIATILLVVVFVEYILSIFMIEEGTKSAFDTLANIVTLFTTFFAAYYMIAGCVKQAKSSYKIFMYGFLISLVLDLVAVMDKGFKGTVIAFPIALPIVFVSILATGKDLGKTKTITLCALLLACIAYLFVVNIVMYKDNTDLGFSVLVVNSAKLALSLTACVLVLGKYKDKEERHKNDNQE